MTDDCCPPPGSKRAARAAAGQDAQGQGGASDAGGVLGMFGVVAFMGLCCGVLPLVLAGVLTVGALAAGLPWLGAALALVGVAWWAARLRRRRDAGGEPHGLAARR